MSKLKPFICYRIFVGYRRWEVHYSKHSSTYSIPITSGRTLKEAWDNFVKYAAGYLI